MHAPSNRLSPVFAAVIVLLSSSLVVSCETDVPEEAAATDSPLAAAGPRALAFEAFGRENLIHGIAGDARLVFVTEPLHGAVVAHDRFTGREVGRFPPPAGGFLLPFTLRVSRAGRLVVLDAGGFPNPGTPTVPRLYEYTYAYAVPRGHGHEPGSTGRTFSAALARSVRFDGIPVGFSEDFELLENGSAVVSDSILGSLWLVEPDGAIVPGIVPDGFGPGEGVPALAPCIAPPATVDGLPYALTGNFAPGVGALTADDRHVYFGQSCLGGLYRVPIRSLRDTTRSPSARAADVETVVPGRPGEFQIFKGLVFDPAGRGPHWLYALEPLGLRLVRIDVATGRREVLVEDPALLNFPVAASFLPSPDPVRELVIASDQEHRFAAINTAISTDMFQPPFLVTKVLTPRR